MSCNVVIVDDDPMIGALLSAVLRNAGRKVTAVSEALDGLAAVRGAAPDLVFLDAMMPNKDGYELARDIRDDASIVAQPSFDSVDCDRRPGRPGSGGERRHR